MSGYHDKFKIQLIYTDANKYIHELLKLFNIISFFQSKCIVVAIFSKNIVQHHPVNWNYPNRFDQLPIACYCFVGDIVQSNPVGSNYPNRFAKRFAVRLYFDDVPFRLHLFEHYNFPIQIVRCPFAHLNSIDDRLFDHSVQILIVDRFQAVNLNYPNQFVECFLEHCYLMARTQVRQPIQRKPVQQPRNMDRPVLR